MFVIPYEKLLKYLRPMLVGIWRENTVCRRLQHSGLLSFRAAKKPFISAKNRKARNEFEMLVDTELLMIVKEYSGAMNQSTF